MECYSSIKNTTDLSNNTGESQKHAEWKKPSCCKNKTLILWFHLHEIQIRANLTYGDRLQIVDGEGGWQERGMMERLRDGNDLCLVLNGSYATVYSCQNSCTKQLRSVYYISILFKKKKEESVFLCQNFCRQTNNPRWEPRECEKSYMWDFLEEEEAFGCLQSVQICLCYQNPSKEC